MEREANYAAVGAFVLLVVLMAGLFVYWYSDGRDSRSFTRYEIYFRNSVSGLAEGSVVRYLGVDVGRVHRIGIDPRDARRVQIIADIDSKAPVSEQTVAELSLQGVTGLLYIDLLGAAGSKTLLEPVASERYPVIRSVRSSLDEILQGLPEAVANVGRVAARFERLFSDVNIDAMTRMVANLDAASQALPGTMRDVEAITAQIRVTSQEVAAVASSMRTLTESSTPGIRVAIERFSAMAENLASTSQRIDQLVAENQLSVRSFTNDGLPEIERLAREGRETAAELQSLSRALRDNPSQIIFQPPRRGVEVPR